jgi:hypothetical protein
MVYSLRFVVQAIAQITVNPKPQTNTINDDDRRGREHARVLILPR